MAHESDEMTSLLQPAAAAAAAAAAARTSPSTYLSDSLIAAAGQDAPSASNELFLHKGWSVCKQVYVFSSFHRLLNLIFMAVY